MSSEAESSSRGGTTPVSQGGDFRRLRETGEKGGVSRAIGGAIGTARDAVARGLIFIGATPNRISVAGLVLTCGAGYCLVKGASDQVPYFYGGDGNRSWWPAWAALFMVLAGACDMLDGAVARVGNMASRFGGILDSTLDRFADMALLLGCALHYALNGNLTGQVLAVGALCSAVLISYVKARAEETIEDCSVGYWLRGERVAAVLIACASGHVFAVLWQLALLPALTVWRRIDFAWRAADAMDRGLAPPVHGPIAGFWGRFQLWRHPRGSVPYDVVTGLNIAYIVVAPWFCPFLLGHGGSADPLRLWLGG